MKLEGFPDMHVPSLKTHAICIQVFMHIPSTLHPTQKKKKQKSKIVEYLALTQSFPTAYLKEL